MLKIIFIIIGTATLASYKVESAIASPDLALRDPIIAQNREFPVNGVQRDRQLTRILILAGLVSAVGLVGWQLSRQGRSGRITPVLSKISNKALIDRVSPKLRRQLLRLINDPKTANRLLMGIEKDHPHRDPDWFAEKVIYDLRRGR